MYGMTEQENLEWFIRECKMKLIERASWRDFESLWAYSYLPINKCFPDYIDENGNFYSISCFEEENYVGHLSQLEPIYDSIVDKFWNDRIFHELYEKHEKLFEEDCYELADTL